MNFIGGARASWVASGASISGAVDPVVAVNVKMDDEDEDERCCCDDPAGRGAETAGETS